ncbi:hypothetical protein Dsin_018878, partial [Dipteronia sinensis]
SPQFSDNIVLALNYSSDPDTTSSSTQSDYYPDKQPCICKEINVLDQHDYSMIIGMIDSINDPSIKAKYIKELQQKILTNQTKPSPQPTTDNSYSTPDFDSNVIGRFQSKPRKITISDLQTEVQKLKDEIRLIKITIAKLEHTTPIQTDNKNHIPINNKNPNFNSSSDSDQNQDNSPDEGISNQSALSTIINPSSPQIGQIKTYKIQKWYIEIDIRIAQDYNLIVNALVDTGADLNCMREALVPTKYLEKTTESLFGANKQQLDIKYKLANAKVCNQDICYTTDFVMVKTISQNVILGLPFLHLISPFKVTSEGIVTEYLNKDILFPFIYPLIIRDLDTLKRESIHYNSSPLPQLDQCIANLNIKQRQLSFLKDDLSFEKQNFQLDIPFWFLEWWDKYGPTTDILPPNVNEGYQYWLSHFDKPSIWDFIPDLLIYFKHFSLTWILMLEYAIIDKLVGNINVPYFGRQTKIKWWSGMNIADLGTQRVASWFNENPFLCKTLIDQSPFLMAKSQSRAQLAVASSRLATASTSDELRAIAKDMEKAMTTISSQMDTGSSEHNDRNLSDDDDPTRFFCHDESES